jgi:membrane-bound metal-dependent hydrolase YbcI (DUF457 family)
MYVGHLAAGLVLKARVREAPLTWLLFATVVSDLLCGALLIAGAEQVVIHDSMKFANSDAHMPYSHSLLGTLLLAAAATALATRAWSSRRIGSAVGLAVLSHYVLDVLTHLPDMPVIGFGAQPDLVLGTRLAAYPLAHYVVELAWCLFAWAVLDVTNKRLLWTLLLLMVPYANTLMGFIELPPPPSAAVGISMLVLFSGTPLLLLWAARKSEAQR